MFPSPLFALVLTAFVTQLALLITTLYLHRALSHRAVTLSPGVAGACRLVLWVTTGIRPRQWVAVHRKHHAHADEDGDPHSPLIEGFNKVQYGNAWLYRRVAKDRAAVARYARDLPPDRWDRALFDHALLGLVIGTGLLCLVLGPGLGLLAAGAHAVAYLLISGAVNAVGHRFGDRPHDNLATNGQLLAWLAWGEGLHNNHHAAPTSARFAMAPGEVDPGWWVVALLQRLGWARVRHDRPVMLRSAA